MPAIQRHRDKVQQAGPHNPPTAHRQRGRNHPQAGPGNQPCGNAEADEAGEGGETDHGARMALIVLPA